MTENYLPGTNVPYADGDDVTYNIRMMTNSTNGLSLSQLCSITNLEPSTIQNWVKRGYLFKPVNKKYYERHVARVLIIKSLKGSLLIEEVNNLMSLLNGELEDRSDDIISDDVLYAYFCAVIKSLDEIGFNEEDIDKSIDKVLENYDKRYYEKLKHALNVMTYSYISNLCNETVEKHFKDLRKVSKNS